MGLIDLGLAALSLMPQFSSVPNHDPQESDLYSVTFSSFSLKPRLASSTSSPQLTTARSTTATMSPTTLTTSVLRTTTAPIVNISSISTSLRWTNTTSSPSNGTLTTMRALVSSNSTQPSNKTSQLTIVPRTDSAPAATGSLAAVGAVDAELQISIAAYINPISHPDSWPRLLTYDKNKISVLVGNILNGPDSDVHTEWKSVIDNAIAAGQRVLGYVQTGYFSMSQQKYTTRLGSTDLADWAAQIQQDVDKWYELYGNSIAGIFFDEALPVCGDNNTYANLFSHLDQNTKRKHPNAFTVLNPGTSMPQCFENSADTLMTFESSYQAYTSGFIGSDWTPSDPRKIWHVIYNVPQGAIAEVANLARQRGVGHVQITNDNLPNPYDDLPDDAYMQALLDTVSGGSPNIGAYITSAGDGRPIPSSPAAPTISATDWTSVGLSWPAVEGAASYRVHINNKDVVSLPSSMSKVRIANLTPGTTYSLTLTALSATGEESAPSTAVSITTTSLPNNKIIVNGRDPATISASSTVYQVDILVPYSSERLFISGLPNQDCGWGISFTGNVAPFCADYMVEGTAVYAYTGMRSPRGSAQGASSTWSWAAVGNATLVIDSVSYTHRWTVPLGSAQADVGKFVVQTSGYGPYQNVWRPCPVAGEVANNNGTYCV